MAASAPSTRKPQAIAADIGRLRRYKPDADTTPLYAELHASTLERAVRELAAKFPPLTDDQRDRIAALVRAGGAEK